MADPVGQTLGGYPVEKLLDKGAYDLLYQVQTSAQPIGAKLLREDLRADAQLAATVQQGWEKARGIAHANLIAAYSGGAEPAFGPYCIEELVKSRSLRKMVLDGTKIAFRDALEITGQVTTALQALHDGGAAHGDVNPGNIQITLDQDVKLEGAGTLAQVARPLAGILTGTALGYSAPERLAGSAATPASDFYGLGASLYFLLAGRDPFPGTDSQAVAQAAQTKEPTPLSGLAEHLAPGAGEFVARLMAKQPAQRYWNAADVLEDLNNLRAGKPLAPLKPNPNAAPVMPAALEATMISRPSPVPAASPLRASAATLPSTMRASSAGLPAARMSGLRPGVGPRSNPGFVSGLQQAVAPTESGRFRAAGPAVFGKLETQVGSTIPQSERERQGDDLFRRGQLAQALKAWQEAWDGGNQHGGLRAKIDLGNREHRKSQYQTSINEAKWLFESGQYLPAADRAMEAQTLADSDVQRSESKMLADMAMAKNAEASKKAAKNKIVAAVVVIVLIVGLLAFLLLKLVG